AVSPGLSPPHRPAVAQVRLSAAHRPPLRAGRRGGPLGAVPPDADARLGGSGGAADHASAGGAGPSALSAPFQQWRRSVGLERRAEQGASGGAGMAGLAARRRGAAPRLV